MGAIFFYIFIYFAGYYGLNLLNMLTIRPLIKNRHLAALLPVYAVALTHAYILVSSPPPQGTDITVEYALLVFITLPVVVVTIGAIYFMWNSKGGHPDNAPARSAASEVETDTHSASEVQEKATDKPSDSTASTQENSLASTQDKPKNN